MRATIPCPECGLPLDVPAGAKPGDAVACPTWAAIALRLSRHEGEWRATLLKRATCAVGEEEVILPDDAQPGDILECHGMRQRVTYEYGAWALERLPEKRPWGLQIWRQA